MLWSRAIERDNGNAAGATARLTGRYCCNKELLLEGNPNEHNTVCLLGPMSRSFRRASPRLVPVSFPPHALLGDLKLFGVAKGLHPGECMELSPLLCLKLIKGLSLARTLQQRECLVDAITVGMVLNHVLLQCHATTQLALVMKIGFGACHDRGC